MRKEFWNNVMRRSATTSERDVIRADEWRMTNCDELWIRVTNCDISLYDRTIYWLNRTACHGRLRHITRGKLRSTHVSFGQKANQSRAKMDMISHRYIDIEETNVSIGRSLKFQIQSFINIRVDYSMHKQTAGRLGSLLINVCVSHEITHDETA